MLAKIEVLVCTLRGGKGLGNSLGMSNRMNPLLVTLAQTYEISNFRSGQVSTFCVYNQARKNISLTHLDVFNLCHLKHTKALSSRDKR